MVRIKHRYLLFNILYPTPPTAQPSSAPELPPYMLFSRPSPEYLTSKLFLSALRSRIQSLFGDHGLSVTQSALRIVYFSPRTSTVIVRVPRAHFRLVWATLTLTDTLPRPPDGGMPVKCVVRVVRVSGTIRKSEEEVLRRARREIVRAKREGRGGEKEDEAVLDGLLGGIAQSKGKTREREASPPAQQDYGIEDPDSEDDMDDLSE